MTLGEVIQDYRLTFNLSQREFAKKCGVSNGTINMIEKEVTKDGQPVKVSMHTMKAIADGMETPLNSLMDLVGDADPEAPSQISTISASDRKFMSLFRQLSDDQKNLIIGTMNEFTKDE